MNRKGKLLVVAAPSGAGKTSLVKALKHKIEGVRISVSYTTRPRRAHEVDGVDYHFISKTVYQTMLDQSAFLEHATVFGHHYGTAKAWVLKQLDKGIDVILEIDWQGARQIRELFCEAVSIFILPPSLAELQQRLEKRAQDTEQVIASRMEQSQAELTHYAEFDYLIVNMDFDNALNDLQHIVFAERLRCTGQRLEQAELLEELLQNR